MSEASVLSQATTYDDKFLKLLKFKQKGNVTAAHMFQKASAEEKRRLTGLVNGANEVSEASVLSQATTYDDKFLKLLKFKQKGNVTAAHKFQKASAEEKRRLTGLVSVAQRSRRRSEHTVTRF